MQFLAICFYLVALAAVIWSVWTFGRGLYRLTNARSRRDGIKTLILGVVGALSVCAFAVCLMRSSGGDMGRIDWVPPFVFVVWGLIGFGWPHAALIVLRRRRRTADATPPVGKNGRPVMLKLAALTLLVLYVGGYGVMRIMRFAMHHSAEVDGYSHHSVADIGYRWDGFRSPPFPVNVCLPLIYLEVALWYTFKPVGSAYP